MPVGAIQRKAACTPQQQLEDLLSAIARRDQQAMADFYDQTHRTVYGLLCRLLPERAIAEAVLLEVYEEVWREAARAIKSQRMPLGWLIQLARQRALGRIKNSTRQKPGMETSPVRMNCLPEKDWLAEQRQL
ncbi:MAG: hypothetical protein ACRD82_13090, partial [Blastocatellia bacterium]